MDAAGDGAAFPHSRRMGRSRLSNSRAAWLCGILTRLDAARSGVRPAAVTRGGHRDCERHRSLCCKTQVSARHIRYALEAGEITLLENGRGAFEVQQER